MIVKSTAPHVQRSLSSGYGTTLHRWIGLTLSGAKGRRRVMERHKCIVVEGWKFYLAIIVGVVVLSFATFGAIMLVYVWVCGLEYAAIETMKAWGRGAGGFR
jgi:hypothetical protein